MGDAEAQAPTKSDIEALVAFLPRLSEATEPVSEWRNDTANLPHPIYQEWIEEFVRLAGSSCWSDYGYVQSGGREMIEDDETVKNASIKQITTMLTNFVRGERFVEGLWGDLMRRGRILAVLQRLRQILDTER